MKVAGRSISAWVAVGLACGALGLSAQTLVAQKTDVLKLRNGDRVTGAILSLQRGRLNLDADKAGGKVRIKWRNIVQLTSDKTFEIQFGDGQRVFGSFRPADGDSLIALQIGDSLVTVNQFRVVHIKPVKQTFWQRWEGSLSGGLTTLGAADQTDYNINWNSKYRGRGFDVVIGYNSFFRTQSETQNTVQNYLSLGYVRLRDNNWFVTGLGSVANNSDLGLDFRGTGGGGLGRVVLANYRMNISLGAGLVYNNERFVGVDEATNSLEAMGAFEIETFLFGGLDTEINARLVVSPSLTEGGRVRLRVNTDAKRELVTDFYLTATFLDDFDNQPSNPELPHNDYTLTLGVSWSFE